jgi:hypothetical protein
MEISIPSTCFVAEHLDECLICQWTARGIAEVTLANTQEEPGTRDYVGL